jgi:hypothetical protein
MVPVGYQDFFLKLKKKLLIFMLGNSPFPKVSYLTLNCASTTPYSALILNGKPSLRQCAHLFICNFLEQQSQKNN